MKMANLHPLVLFSYNSRIFPYLDRNKKDAHAVAWKVDFRDFFDKHNWSLFYSVSRMNVRKCIEFINIKYYKTQTGWMKEFTIYKYI